MKKHENIKKIFKNVCFGKQDIHGVAVYENLKQTNKNQKRKRVVYLASCVSRNQNPKNNRAEQGGKTTKQKLTEKHNLFA